MPVTKTIRRVGGSLGVLIPKDFATALAISEGSEVQITLHDEVRMLTIDVPETVGERLSRVRGKRGRR